jgi:hypothetical protein
VPRNQHRPSQEERDERVTLDLPADEAIKLILETGEHPDEEEGTEPSSKA